MCAAYAAGVITIAHDAVEGLLPFARSSLRQADAKGYNKLSELNELVNARFPIQHHSYYVTPKGGRARA